MRPLYSLLIVFNLFSLSLFPKQRVSTVDSLKKLIFPALKNKAGAPDKLTIQRINKLADEYFESYPDSTLYYGNLEIKLSEKINYILGTADGYTQLAAVNTFRGDYNLSAKNYNTALTLYKQVNNNYGIGKCYIGLGRIHDYLGSYDSAVHLFTMALNLRIKAGNESDIADCYNIMGITYDNKGEFSKALDCYYKALIINIKHKDNLAAADNYCNIGTIMQYLEFYPKALNYYNHALAIWQQTDDKQGISTIYENIGETLIAQKKYTAAIGYLTKASTMFHDLGDQEGISLVEYDLGLYDYYTNHTDAAIQHLNLSLQSATQNKIKFNAARAYEGLALVYNLEKHYTQAYSYAIKAQLTANNLGSLSTKAHAAFQVSNALAGMKHFEEAYREHQYYTVLKDSMSNNENINKLISYNLEVDFLKKQKEIIDQQQKI